MNRQMITALRRAFCKDIFNAFEYPDDPLPQTYPAWAKEFAAHMVEMGWIKPGVEPAQSPLRGPIPNERTLERRE